MNIVFGGSFNPPTIAHKEIVDLMIKKFNPNNVIILPVGNSYKKADLAPFINRFEMLEIMFRNYSNVIISDIEENEFLGTYESLKRLNKKFDDLYFVMGADNFLYLDKWIKWENLLNEFKFIIFNRLDENLNNLLDTKYKKYKNNFILIDYENNISATEFRRNKIKYKNYIDESVFKYIQNNNLYEVNVL